MAEDNNDIVLVAKKRKSKIAMICFAAMNILSGVYSSLLPILNMSSDHSFPFTNNRFGKSAS